MIINIDTLFGDFAVIFKVIRSLIFTTACEAGTDIIPF